MKTERFKIAPIEAEILFVGGLCVDQKDCSGKRVVRLFETVTARSYEINKNIFI